jgi:alpha-glucosidase
MIPGKDRSWWRGAALYQIYPRSFQDTNGDGIGDLKGVIQRLPHIADLGVDAIWISPFFTSPMADYGYDVSDYRNVDPMFGTLEDFKALLNTAHDLGLRVTIDQVLSHTSEQHPWFKESRKSHENPYADYYVWADPKPDGGPPNNWLSLFGGCGWEWDARRQQYYFHNFLRQQPDLNFHNPRVQDELLDVVRFWLELGVDGFRFDTANFYVHDKELRDNPPNLKRESADIPLGNPYAWQDHIYDKSRPENLIFLERLRALLDSYGATTSVGEIGDADRTLETIAAYTQDDKRMHMCYGFDYLSRSFGKAHFEKTMRDFERVAGKSWGCWAFSNHDVERHATRWSSFMPDRNRLATFCIALLASMRGSICIYQGEELGFGESDIPFDLIQDPYGRTFWPEFKGRDGCRTPMAWTANSPNAGFSNANRTWLPVDIDHQENAADTQVQDQESVLASYKRYLALRRAHEALRSGEIEFVPSASDVLAYFRSTPGEKILCVFNFSNDEHDFDLPDDAQAINTSQLRATTHGSKLTLQGGGAAYFNMNKTRQT